MTVPVNATALSDVQVGPFGQGEIQVAGVVGVLNPVRIGLQDDSVEASLPGEDPGLHVEGVAAGGVAHEDDPTAAALDSLLEAGQGLRPRHRAP